MKKEKVDLYIGEEFWKEWKIKEDSRYPDEKRTRVFVPVDRFNEMLQAFQGVVALEFARKHGSDEFYLCDFVHRAY